MNKYREKTRKELKKEIEDLKYELRIYRSALRKSNKVEFRSETYDIVTLKNQYMVSSTAPDEYVKRYIRKELAKNLDEVIEYEKTFDDGVYKEIRAKLHVLRKESK